MATAPAPPTAPERRLESPWHARLRLMRRNFASNWELFWESRIGPIGLVIIIFFGLLAFANPILTFTIWDPSIYDPVYGFDINPGPEWHEQRVMRGEADLHPAPPSAKHWLGTDPWGRDIFSQLSFSARAEFFLGVMAALITVIIGTLVAATAAYYGGFVDTFFMRLADVLILFPVIAFLIVLSSMFQLTLYSLAIVLGLIGGFGGITIVLKSQALSIKVKPFVEAARVSGGSSFHIIMTHIIPNLLPLSFLYMMFSVTSAIFSEAVLSFFGLISVQMSWGLMVEMAYISGYLTGDAVLKAWWIFFPASLSITAITSSFYLVGRGLDEIVNPRLRRI